MFFKYKFPTQKQIEIWNYNRKNYKGREIAFKESVTPGFVSKTLKEANKRIKDLIILIANSNKIELKEEDIFEEDGYARGYSFVFNIPAKITFSPVNGVQVWYEHKGDCISCTRFDQCRKLIIQELKERDIKIDNTTLEPTILCERLIENIEDRIK
jgi:hypothetical protein